MRIRPPQVPVLRNDPGTVTIPQYRFNKTKQHTLDSNHSSSDALTGNVILTMHCGTTELRAYCRPTETGFGPSDARIASAASHWTGVFLPCAWCLELSRTLEDPHWIRRRRDRPLCAPQVRPAHTRQRATGARTMSVCLSCVVILCYQSHCRATLQCRPLRVRA